MLCLPSSPKDFTKFNTCSLVKTRFFVSVDDAEPFEAMPALISVLE
jgi:hypothetical protein